MSDSRTDDTRLTRQKRFKYLIEVTLRAYMYTNVICIFDLKCSLTESLLHTFGFSNVCL